MTLPVPFNVNRRAQPSCVFYYRAGVPWYACTPFFFNIYILTTPLHATTPTQSPLSCQSQVKGFPCHHNPHHSNREWRPPPPLCACHQLLHHSELERWGLSFLPPHEGFSFHHLSLPPSLEMRTEEIFEYFCI